MFVEIFLLQGSSEYFTEYKWVDSFKSNTFVPTHDQAAPVAGLSSLELGAESGYLS